MADTEKKVQTAAEKEAAKAAEKAKKERIKASKPKKEGSAASRAGKSIKKFWKDFTGTIKKVVWPGPKQVVKSSLVVLVSVIVVGLVIFGFDSGLKALFNKTVEVVEEAAANKGETEAVTDEATEPASGTENESESEAESTTEAESENEAESTSEEESENEAESTSEAESENEAESTSENTEA